MADDLFALNHPQMQKVFESHSENDSVVYTDFLKICTGLRVFPDLISSRDLRSITSSMVEGSEKVSVSDSEKIFAWVAETFFASAGDSQEKQRLFFIHVKSPCYLRYGIEFILSENSENRNTDSLKSIIPKKVLSGLNLCKNRSAKVSPKHFGLRKTDSNASVINFFPISRLNPFDECPDEAKKLLKITKLFESFRASSAERSRGLKILQVRGRLKLKYEKVSRAFSMWTWVINNKNL